MIKKGCGCHKHQEPIPEEQPIVIPEVEPIPCPENTQVKIINQPDEEDLTEVLNGADLVLKFKNKVYNPVLYSGYGRVFLRKNLQDSEVDCPSKVNILTQSMFMDESGQFMDNTIFIVQYDYDLNNKFISLPINSVLLFLGGSFKNGTLILNNTLVLPQASNKEEFLKCIVAGKYKEGQIFYEDGKLKYWNGLTWVSLGDFESTESILPIIQQQIGELVATLTGVQNTVGGFDSAIQEIRNALTDKANKVHFHAIEDILDLATQLSNKLTSGSITINGIPLTNGANLTINGGGGGDFSLVPASSSNLGGIKLGFISSVSTPGVPVKLNASNQAYVDISNVTSQLGTISTTLNDLGNRIVTLEGAIQGSDGIDLSTLQNTLEVRLNSLISERLTPLNYAINHYETLNWMLGGWDNIAAYASTNPDQYRDFYTYLSSRLNPQIHTNAESFQQNGRIQFEWVDFDRNTTQVLLRLNSELTPPNQQLYSGYNSSMTFGLGESTQISTKQFIFGGSYREEPGTAKEQYPGAFVSDLTPSFTPITRSSVVERTITLYAKDPLYNAPAIIVDGAGTDYAKVGWETTQSNQTLYRLMFTVGKTTADRTDKSCLDASELEIVNAIGRNPECKVILTGDTLYFYEGGSKKVAFGFGQDADGYTGTVTLPDQTSLHFTCGILTAVQPEN